MIILLESLRMAFASLRQNTLRAVLTILGIVIGVAAVVALTSIGSGSTRSVESSFSSFGSDTITVQSSPFTSSGKPLSSSDVAAINATPGVKQTVTAVTTNATVTLGVSSATESVMGTSTKIVGIDHLTTQAGRFFSAFDAGHSLPMAVLGSTVASDLGISPLRAVGQTVSIGGEQFQVVGVLAAQGGVGFASVDSDIIVPLSSIEGRLVSFRPDISQIRVQAYPIGREQLPVGGREHAAHAARPDGQRPERLPDRERQLHRLRRLLLVEDAHQADGRDRRHQPPGRRHRRGQRHARHGARAHA